MTKLVRMNRRGKKRGYPGGDRGLPLGIFSYFSVYTILSATISSAPISSKKSNTAINNSIRAIKFCTHSIKFASMIHKIGIMCIYFYVL